MNEIKNLEEKRIIREGRKFYGMRAKPKLWEALQQDKKAFGKVRKGIDVGRLSEEEYMQRVTGQKQVVFSL